MPTDSMSVGDGERKRLAALAREYAKVFRPRVNYLASEASVRDFEAIAAALDAPRDSLGKEPSERPTIEAMRECFRRIELFAKWGRNLPDSDDLALAKKALESLSRDDLAALNRADDAVDGAAPPLKPPSDEAVERAMTIQAHEALPLYAEGKAATVDEFRDVVRNMLRAAYAIDGALDAAPPTPFGRDCGATNGSLICKLPASHTGPHQANTALGVANWENRGVRDAAPPKLPPLSESEYADRRKIVREPKDNA